MGPTPVPVENRGGGGTRDSHWRETVFQQELMTGWVGEKPNPMSRLTIASLKDIGYVVDLTKAETYKLPDLAMLAEAGTLTTHIAPLDHGVMLPSIPIVLPDIWSAANVARRLKAVGPAPSCDLYSRVSPSWLRSNRKCGPDRMAW